MGVNKFYVPRFRRGPGIERRLVAIPPDFCIKVVVGPLHPLSLTKRQACATWSPAFQLQEIGLFPLFLFHASLAFETHFEPINLFAFSPWYVVSKCKIQFCSVNLYQYLSVTTQKVYIHSILWTGQSCCIHEWRFNIVSIGKALLIAWKSKTDWLVGLHNHLQSSIVLSPK